MLQVYRYLFLFLLAAGCLSAGKSAGENRVRFPPPDRPVAPIVSSAYAAEQIRDANGEAGRVMDRIGITRGSRIADIGAGDGYYTVRLVRRFGSKATVYAQDVNADHLN